MLLSCSKTYFRSYLFFILFYCLYQHVSFAQVTGFKFSPDSGCVGSTFGVTVTADGPTKLKIDGQTSNGFYFEQGSPTIIKILTPTPIYLTNINRQPPLTATGSVSIPANTPPGKYDGIIFYTNYEISDADLINDYDIFDGPYAEYITWQCKGCFTVKPSYPFYVDADGDGYGAGNTVSLCVNDGASPPSGYSINNTDCDDGDNAIHPGALEICDSKDNDCDGQTDEGDASFHWDSTAWSSCSAACGPGTQTRTVTCKNASNVVVIDCNCAGTKPVAAQSCNGSGQLITWYLDADNDGYAVSTTVSCTSPGAGYGTTVKSLGDCNDSNLNINPGAGDTNCNGIDEDCDGTADDGYVPTNCIVCQNGNTVNTAQTWYLDADNDGYAISTTVSCTSPGTGYGTTVKSLGDCNDSNLNINPGASDTNCNGIDEDCDGTADDGYVPANCLFCQNGNTVNAAQTWYLDADNDGHAISTTVSCSSPGIGYGTSVKPLDDCNDSDASINPTATELCDSKDNDCDGQTDEGHASFQWDVTAWGSCSSSCGSGTQSRTVTCKNASNAVVPDCNCIGPKPAISQACSGANQLSTWYRDTDNDGYGNAASSKDSCAQPSGYVSNNLDCNDTNSNIKPSASDSNCNGIDEDCDGIADDNYVSNTCAVCQNGVVVNSVSTVAITGLSVSNIATTSVTLSWNATNLFSTYDLEYKASQGGSWIILSNLAVTTYNLLGLTANKSYNWRVRGKCANGNLGSYGTSSFTTAALPCSVPPSGLNATNITGTGAILTWKPVQGANDYTVQWLNANYQWITLTTSNTTTYNWVNLTSKTFYMWRVAANCSSGSTRYTISLFRTKNSLQELENRSLDFVVKAYPNPVADNLTIELPDETLTAVSLYDLHGKLIQNFVPIKSFGIIQMKDIASGLYILKISNVHETRTVKLIKE